MGEAWPPKSEMPNPWRDEKGNLRPGKGLPAAERAEMSEAGLGEYVRETESKPRIYQDFPWMEDAKQGGGERDAEDDARYPIDT